MRARPVFRRRQRGRPSGKRREGVLAVLGAVLLLMGSAMVAGATDNRLGDLQLRQLHQEVCSVPVRLVRENGRDVWVCDRPRNYPRRAGGEECRLSFITSGKTGLTRIYYGEFTAHEPQAIAMYDAACEPHSNYFGGMALFRIADRRFELLRYYPGQKYVDCAVLPSPRHKLETPYCFSSYLGQGERIDLFGPLRFSPDGHVHFEKWLEAGNLDGFLTTMTPCGPGHPGLHHLIAVRLDRAGAAVVVAAASLAPQGYAEACGRYRRHDFNAEEKNFRARFAAAKGQAFIRPDENCYVKLLVRFKVPNRTPQVETTAEPVPQD